MSPLSTESGGVLTENSNDQTSGSNERDLVEDQKLGRRLTQETN